MADFQATITLANTETYDLPLNGNSVVTVDAAPLGGGSSVNVTATLDGSTYRGVVILAGDVDTAVSDLATGNLTASGIYWVNATGYASLHFIATVSGSPITLTVRSTSVSPAAVQAFLANPPTTAVPWKTRTVFDYLFASQDSNGGAINGYTQTSGVVTADTTGILAIDQNLDFLNRVGASLVNTGSVNVTVGYGGIPTAGAGPVLLPGGVFELDGFNFTFDALYVRTASGTATVATTNYTRT